LETKLETTFDGLTIVVTHHAPSYKSIRPEFATDPLTAAYVSDLEETMMPTNLHLWARTRILGLPDRLNTFRL
jgi:hypothetical protein